MLKVELLVNDDREKEELLRKEILRIIMENGINIEKCNIENPRRAFENPELKEIKELQIPDFLKKQNRNTRFCQSKSLNGI